MGSLPRTRPERRSARRPGATGDQPAAKAAPAKAGAAKVAAKPRAKARPAAARAAKAPAKAKATATVKSPAKARVAPKAKATTSSRAKKLPPRGFATPDTPAEPPPSGTALVTTALQAAGELAQIGLAVGGQAVKSALGKLPRP